MTVHLCFSASTAGILKVGLPKSSRVISLLDDLSVGDISQVDYKHRNKVIKTYLAIPETEDEVERYVEHVVKKSYEDFEEVVSEAKVIVIWYSHSPFEYCGMLYTMYLLRGRDIDISMIQCTEEIESRGETWRYRCSAEMHPNQSGHFLGNKVCVTWDKRKHYEQQWVNLVRENDALRVWEADKIVSKSESYYDHYVVEQLLGEPLKIGQLVGKVLNNVTEEMGVSISDSILLYRLHLLEQQGKIKIEGNDKSIYEKRCYSV